MISYALYVLVTFLCAGLLIVFIRDVNASADSLFDEDVEDE